MYQFNFQKLFAILVATTLIVAASSQAHARWGFWGSGGRSWGSRGSSHGSWGSHGGSWGSHGSSGGSYGSWGSNGSSGGSSGGEVTYSEEVIYETTRRSDSAEITVSVPEDARVTVNGRSTTSTGSERRFVSRGLSRGTHYNYEVLATVDRDGETMNKTRVIEVRAGQSHRVTFDFDDAARQISAGTEAAPTRLTLHVPEDAEVTLAGKLTSIAGPVRVYTTTKLSGRSQWSDYTIRVAVVRDDHTLTREQTITLTGGESQTLRFNFEDAQLADVDDIPAR